MNGYASGLIARATLGLPVAVSQVKIYEFTSRSSPPRTAKPLDSWPQKFWQVLDQYCEANAARKTLEAELRRLELERITRFEEHVYEYVMRTAVISLRKYLNRTTRDQQNDNAESAAQPAPPRIADKDSSDGLNDLDVAMELGMNRFGVVGWID